MEADTDRGPREVIATLLRAQEQAAYFMEASGDSRMDCAVEDAKAAIARAQEAVQ